MARVLLKHERTIQNDGQYCQLMKRIYKYQQYVNLEAENTRLNIRIGRLTDTVWQGSG